MWRLLLFLGFMALGTGLVYTIVVREPREPEDAAGPLPFNVLSLEDVHLTFQQAGGQDGEMWAVRAEYDEKRQVVALEQVRFEVTEAPEGGAPPVMIRGTARRATVDNRSGRVVLTGQVHLTRAADLEIKGERMVYEHRAGRVLVPEAVWIRSGTSIQEGRALTYDLGRRAMTLRAPRLVQ